MQSPIASFFSLLPVGIGSSPKRRGTHKKSLTILIRLQAFQELQESARQAAHAQDLAPTTLAYGDFVADHIARSLEAAYQADTAHARVAQTDGEFLSLDDAQERQRDEMTFAAVSLSSAVARELLAQARKDIRRAGTTTDPDPETFMYRRLGQLLEAAYSHRA